jgi:hypothetical protein
MVGKGPLVGAGGGGSSAAAGAAESTVRPAAEPRTGERRVASGRSGDWRIASSVPMMEAHCLATDGGVQRRIRSPLRHPG